MAVLLYNATGLTYRSGHILYGTAGDPCCCGGGDDGLCHDCCGTYEYGAAPIKLRFVFAEAFSNSSTVGPYTGTTLTLRGVAYADVICGVNTYDLTRTGGRGWLVSDITAHGVLGSPDVSVTSLASSVTTTCPSTNPSDWTFSWSDSASQGITTLTLVAVGCIPDMSQIAENQANRATDSTGYVADMTAEPGTLTVTGGFTPFDFKGDSDTSRTDCNYFDPQAAWPVWASAALTMPCSSMFPTLAISNNFLHSGLNAYEYTGTGSNYFLLNSCAQGTLNLSSANPATIKINTANNTVPGAGNRDCIMFNPCLKWYSGGYEQYSWGLNTGPYIWIRGVGSKYAPAGTYYRCDSTGGFGAQSSSLFQLDCGALPADSVTLT